MLEFVLLVLAGASVAAVVAATVRRRRWITDPLWTRLRASDGLPSASDLDELALGDPWIERDILSGAPDFARLLATPDPKLTPEEQAFLDGPHGPVNELCRMVDDWAAIEELRDLPQEAWSYLREKRFFGMIIPREYGGLGFSAHAHAQVIQKLASRSVALGVTAMVPNTIGPAELIMNYGTQAQKDFWLPRLADGTEIPCFGLTGVQAGSDAVSNTPDHGVVCRDQWQGREVLGVRLNFEKRYITLAPVATVVGLAFRLLDPDDLLGLGGPEDKGTTFGLVPTDLPGVEKGRRHNPLYVPFMNGPLRGEGVFIPLENVIGGAAGIGKGRRMLVENLSAGRAISMPALTLAGAKVAARGCGAYARVRAQFGLPLGRFEAVQEPLAGIAGWTWLLNGARTATIPAVESGKKPMVAASIVKLAYTEMARKITNEAMDVMAGKAICLGPRNVFGPMHLAAPIAITVEGANLLTRSVMIFGMGGPARHPFLLDELRILTDEQGDPAQFDRLVAAHARWTLGNLLRAKLHALTGARFAKTPGGPAKKRYQQLARLSACFAVVADALILTLGAGLRRRERLCGRLSDAWSRLYLVDGALKSFEDAGRPADETPLMDWACAESFAVTREALVHVLDNFPVKPLGLALKLGLFPLGAGFRGPTEEDCARAAAVLLTPSPVRDRLTDGIFLPDDPGEPLALLEDALGKVLAAEAAEKQFRAARKRGEVRFGLEADMLAEAGARGLLTPEELRLLEAAAKARRAVIEVDEYDFDHWTR